jgi:hypothetical protein
MRTFALAFLLFLILMCGFIPKAFAASCRPETLSPQQLHTVAYLAHVAPAFDRRDNFTLALTGLLYQESSLCTKRHNVNDPSYGCGGVTPSTAAEVVGSPVALWMLEHNDTLNINIAAFRLSWCLSREHRDMPLALVCYNSGPARAANMTHKEAEGNAYVLAVTCRMRQLAHPTQEL